MTDEEPDFSWINAKSWESLGIIPKDRSVEYRAKSRLTKDDIKELEKPSFKLITIGEVKYLDVFKIVRLYRFVLSTNTGDSWETLSAEEVSANDLDAG